MQPELQNKSENPNPSVALPPVIRVLRLHQWLKNLLVFAPLVLGGKVHDIAVWQKAATGFLAFGLLASGSYIINDIIDRESDRQHWSKRSRPIASGALSVASAGALAFALIAGGLAIGSELGAPSLMVLTAYLLGTLSYSLWLKSHAIIDVVTIAGLFTLRLAFGTVVADVPLSPWLMVLSMSVFLSLALAKRLAELQRTTADSKRLAGRGYRASDQHFVRGVGLASASTAVLIMILYLIEDAFPHQVYGHPKFLWAAPILLFLIFTRIWLKAERDELDDDPVIFAIKDPACAFYCALLGAIFVLAFGAFG